MYKVCSKCKQSKINTDFNKQSSSKDGLNNYCRVCSRASFKAWVPTKKMEVPANHKHCKTCDTVKKAISFVPNTDGADGLYSVCKTCCASRSKKQRGDPLFWQQNKVRNQIYVKANRDKVNIKTAKRRAARLQATVDFGDKEYEDFFMQEIYHLAVIRELATGVKWEVDHIAPLISEFVCGLHWSGNLQLLTEFDNRSKSNVHNPDMQ